MSIHLSGLLPSDKTGLAQNPEGVFVTLVGQAKRLKVSFYKESLDLVDPTVSVYDPASLSVEVKDAAGTVLRTVTMLDPALIKIQKGIWALDTTPAEVAAEGLLTYTWTYKVEAGGENEFGVQFLYCVPISTYSLFTRLRNSVDKQQKKINKKIGYTDSNLLYYYFGAIENINNFSPATSLTLSTFPVQFTQLLVDSATVIALVSQEVFSIDTDLQYSDAGESFVVEHFSKLNTLVGSLMAQIKLPLQQLKFRYLNVGVVLQELPVGDLRLASMANAAPTSALFRNFYAHL